MMGEIIISNKEEFEKKKRDFIEGGKDNLHILSDFDRTLTRAFYKGHKTGSIISRLRDGPYLGEDYAKRAHELFDKYHPIEIDSNLGSQEKNKLMYEWWKAHKELLIEKGLNKEILEKSIKDMIQSDNLIFREGVDSFLKILKNNDIPLMIMTASLQDLVSEFMKLKNVYSDNVHVIGNSFIYENDIAVRIDKIIHTFSKHEMEIHDTPLYGEIVKRKNVILMGDSLGDIGMVDGFEFNNLIKIGFLNNNLEESLEEFKSKYDILITNDGNFDFVNDLLKEIIN